MLVAGKMIVEKGACTSATRSQISQTGLSTTEECFRTAPELTCARCGQLLGGLGAKLITSVT
jgi:hypothetical protein